MKKIISLLLIVAMVGSLGITAFAAIWGEEGVDYTQGTLVEYIGNGSESYTITVPAKLAPGDEGTVTLSGTWADNRTVTVTADTTVTLTNSIKEDDQKVLNVTFAGISETGNNTGSQTFTETVKVDDISNAIFGTWSGKFNYNVEVVDAKKSSFPIYIDTVQLENDAQINTEDPEERFALATTSVPSKEEFANTEATFEVDGQLYVAPFTKIEENEAGFCVYYESLPLFVITKSGTFNGIVAAEPGIYFAWVAVSPLPETVIKIDIA